jgi:protein SCO1/2
MSAIHQIIAVFIAAMILCSGPCPLSLAKQEGTSLLEESKAVLSVSGDGAGKDWITEKTGQFVPLDAEFLDAAGKPHNLREIVDRPTILLPIYFYCPNICSKNLANLAVALNNLRSRPGRDYRVIALSFNTDEGPKDAARAKRNYLKILDKGFPAKEWFFLTGKQGAIESVTKSVGFRFQRLDDETFIHPAALIILAGDGKIIRYVYGSFLAGDIDIGLADAAKGVPSLSVKRLLDFCFNYDPDKNKGTFQLVKVITLLLFAVVVVFVLLYLKKKRPGRSGGA